MMGNRSNLPNLLLLSGIDLLLAALCAAVGILVVLIGTNSATRERVASSAAKPFQDWSLVYLRTGSFKRHVLICNDLQASPVSVGHQSIYVVRLPAGTHWECTLELSRIDGNDGAAVRITAVNIEHPLECYFPSDFVEHSITITREGFSPAVCGGLGAGLGAAGTTMRLEQDEAL